MIGSKSISLFLQDLIHSISNLSDSVYLVGSRTQKKDNVESDIDLIVITLEESGFNEIRYSTKEISKKHRIRYDNVDLKLFTIDEFDKAIHSKDHFFLWNAISNGELLHGKAIKVPFIAAYLEEGLSYWISKINEACSLLDDKKSGQIAGYHIYAGSAWFYFVERNFVKANKLIMNKETFLRSLFGENYQILKTNYNRIRKRKSKQGTIKLRSRSKNHFFLSDCPRQLCDIVGKEVERIYRNAVLKIEQF